MSEASPTNHAKRKLAVPVSAVQEVYAGGDSMTEALWNALLVDGQLNHHSFRSWMPASREIPSFADASVLYVADTERSGSRSWSAIIEGERAFALIFSGGSAGKLRISLAARSRADLDDGWRWVASLLPARETKVDEAEITFVAMSGHDTSRDISVPTWTSIKANYSAAAQAELDKLVNLRDLSEGGKLLLLHGPPGTGKTHLIRSLIREWSGWAAARYIVDPDSFFCSGKYIKEALIDLDEDEKARLLIFEDVGELLAENGAGRNSQQLAKLLNAVDGLIGQGMRIVLLMTTNEELGRLHPAVRRPGRCLANIEIGLFGPDDAARWLREQGYTGVMPSSQITLGEMYALLGDRSMPEQKGRHMGFRPPKGAVSSS